MPELFLELFSEEIPARMQSRAADDLSRLCAEALAPLAPANVRSFHGPRRIALASDVSPQVATSNTTERGPRTNAPEQALAGFLRKHGASREQMRQEGDYWVLRKTAEPVQAATLIASTMPALLRRFPWPTSMRWGGASNFVWVRPLRRIVCLLDGRVVPFDLRDGEDDGHGLASDDLTEGHRFHAPDAFPVISCADWEAKLRKHRVLVDADERRRAIRDGIGELGGARRITPVDDPGLLDEVAGLVEWPVPLLGRIDDAFMDLPPEVRQVSMRVNQRYFAFRHADGSAAPYFGFVANIEPRDGGATSIAGNERVLRARFADARHFWDLDRKARLESRVPLLDHVTFHAKLGSQGERVRRMERLAEEIAPLVGAGPALARDAARLAKADLVTGMVGEFPELQGMMGRYYALHDGEDRLVADAVRDHYAPKGPADAVPTADVSIAVALADKLDVLVGFFAIGERPTGAGDPYALRRAALGIIRIIRENGLWIRLVALIELAGQAFHHRGVHPVPAQEVLDFLAERLRMTLRAEGKRHDVLAAVFAAGADDVIPRLLSRTEAVAALLETDNGANLLTAYRRAANIIRIEARKDGPHDGAPSEALARIDEERGLFRAIADADADISACLRDDNYETALGVLADLRSPLDAFFDKVTVNAQEPELRLNRLRLLHKVRSTMDRIADFSKIEG
ncbi:MAG TPA: glycine--tRNA ligase subunit beta [Acetobacteraceae bacterium]|nr:glycine--tRNA ligase subunit beta [Acetobacteraceae bacterium]